MTQSSTPPRVIWGLGPGAGRDARSATVQGGDGAKPQAALALDRRTYDRALDCVHCGLCLPACPTYTQNGLEADSPRGRIYLMKGMADGRIQPTEAVVRHLDLCLDCRACETACPSGVVYHELIEESRARMQTAPRRTTLAGRFVQWVFYTIFPHPKRVKLAILPARLLQKLGVWSLVTRWPLRKLLPAQLDKMQQMLPPRGPLWEANLAEHYPADPHACVDGKPKATVALLAGCVGSVLFQQVNRQSIHLLQHAGCDVIVSPTQQCCGAIHHHGGRHEDAAAFARMNVDAFETAQPDYIVSNIAGCGAMLVEYAHLLRDDPVYADRAKAFSAKARDISQVLLELAPHPPTHPVKRTVTYHDACHLAHAQKVTAPPRKILSWIEDLTIVPLAESDMCCGAAGTYNLSQPQMASELAERKIRHIRDTGAATCVTGNVGCAMQIQSEADRLGVNVFVVHPVTLLHEAYFGSATVR